MACRSARGRDSEWETSRKEKKKGKKLTLSLLDHRKKEKKKSEILSLLPARALEDPECRRPFPPRRTCRARASCPRPGRVSRPARRLPVRWMKKKRNRVFFFSRRRRRRRLRRQRLCFAPSLERKHSMAGNRFALDLFNDASTSTSPRVPAKRKGHSCPFRRRGKGLSVLRSLSIEMPAAAARTTTAFSNSLSLSLFLLSSLLTPFSSFAPLLPFPQASSTLQRRRPGASESRPDTSGSVTR